MNSKPLLMAFMTNVKNSLMPVSKSLKVLKIPKVPSLKKKTRYINLLKLHKNYFNLKNDLGLFNALNLYTVREDKQAHNALDDAQVTREIFNGFKKAINYNFHPDLSKYQ